MMSEICGFNIWNVRYNELFKLSKIGWEGGKLLRLFIINSKKHHSFCFLLLFGKEIIFKMLHSEFENVCYCIIYFKSINIGGN